MYPLAENHLLVNARWPHVVRGRRARDLEGLETSVVYSWATTEKIIPLATWWTRQHNTWPSAHYVLDLASDTEWRSDVIKMNTVRIRISATGGDSLWQPSTDKLRRMSSSQRAGSRSRFLALTKSVFGDERRPSMRKYITATRILRKLRHQSRGRQSRFASPRRSAPRRKYIDHVS